MSTPPPDPDLSGFNFERPGSQLPPWVLPPRQKRRRKWPFVVAAVFALLVIIGLVAPKEQTDTSAKAADTSTAATSTMTSTSAPTTSTSTPTAEPTLAVAPVAGTVTAAAPANAALAKLNTLAVKGRAPKTGYSREQFGQAWSDDVNVESGHNGCDTRNDILRRDLTAITVKPGTHGCAVATGTLADPYTGKTIPFTRGSSTSSAVQIDHVVALSDAWQKGAQQLTAEQRRFLANDPRNLQATDGPTNQKKGDGDAATWLVPNTGYRCTYVARQIDVKALYKLWVTQAEKDAMIRVLTTCGATPPAMSAAPRPAPTRTSTATPAPAPTTRAYVPPPATTPYTPAPAPAYEPPAQAAPDVDASVPSGATAICNDGTFSKSKSRSGTCSRHGGVAKWL
ncbi:DUF1524 domain-containing protein [uncultured Williamsia sp.]|uniref:GmrSD restriction endonuclease domain-containing protein n=1 Tax=uncultured Williamsia sp. TaxID=259311 RepID=UPI0026333880|nr:DUF1524 domain-containing protein [uncultured Williamsia sp.]